MQFDHVGHDVRIRCAAMPQNLCDRQAHPVLQRPAIYAYWKRVAGPAQGVFVDEPLAAPYR
ncbi:hypothetical protein [Actimicrobium antarcticum]|uniref:Uncharacterized protein n=1 Tax=Actimicrobium antarcticum TaxID=1051899 RepID=A0ABP7T4T5_9BURK